MKLLLQSTRIHAIVPYSKTPSVRFLGDIPSEKKEPVKKPLHEWVEPETNWGKKHDFGWTKIGMWGEGKIDIAVVALTFLSAFIHPLLVISLPLLIARCVIRYIQGVLTPVDRINAYWEAVRSNKKPNVYKWK